jgi:hypothetical protein
MLIKLENKGKYPPNWQELRQKVLRRAGGVRSRDGKTILVEAQCESCAFYPGCTAVNHQPHPVTGSKVVLGIAHRCHDERCERLDHLLALCNRCHLKLDEQQHKQNAAQTRPSARQSERPSDGRGRPTEGCRHPRWRRDGDPPHAARPGTRRGSGRCRSMEGIAWSHR